jgi:hypothetical protein
MNTHEIVNLIIEKFGGNRVKFDFIKQDFVEFMLGDNLYRCGWNIATKRLIVIRPGRYSLREDNYSRWVEGVLNGMVRNDAGELVEVAK